MLIFDGDCGFCTSTARWVVDRVTDDVSVQPWQALELAPLGLTERDVTTAAYWVDDDGRTHRGHRAVAHALEAIGGRYRPLGWLLLRPPASWAAALGYNLVARFRYRLPGSTDACRLR